MAKEAKTVHPYPKATALKVWLDKASKDLREELTYILGTADQMYSQWISGRRGISAEMARRIDVETRIMFANKYGLRTDKTPPPVLQGDICVACSKCAYFREHPEVVKRGTDSDLV